MRSAPPARWRLEGDPVWWALCCLGMLAMVVGLLTWCALLWQGDPWFDRTARSAVCLLGMGVGTAALYCERPSRHRGTLAWDGAEWWFAGSSRNDRPQPGMLSVRIDLGGWMLLRFEPAVADRTTPWSSCRHLAVRARRVGTAWHDLRCAAYGGADGLQSDVAQAPWR